MINSLSIKNFRSYKDVHVDFDPGLNVIIGGNDQGKSNLLRAINLVAQNSPNGDSYIYDWGNSAGDVDIKMDIGGKTVGRYRGTRLNKKEGKYKFNADENIYTLSGEKQPFKSFGQGVPKLIQEHLNLSPLNINFQMDSPFLLDKNPADTAKFYNELVNLEIIDKTISNIASTLRREKADLKVEEELQKRKTEELKEFDWLNGAEKKLLKLEKQQGYIKKLSQDWSNLCDWINRLKKLEEQSIKLNEITKYEKTVLALLDKNKEIKKLEDKSVELFGLINDHRRFSDDLEELNKIVKHEKRLNDLILKANEIEKNIQNEDKLFKYIEELKEYKEQEKQYTNIIKFDDVTKALLVLDGEIEKGISLYNGLQDLLEKRVSLDQEYNKTDIKIKKLEKEFSKLMPDKCPLCERVCNCRKEI